MLIKKPFYFIRHGETAWNAIKKIQGQQDIPLNETGTLQAIALQSKVNELSVDNVFYSPLQRAAKTAEIVSRDLLCPKIAIDGLKEIYLGNLEGTIKTGVPVLEQLKEAGYSGESLEDYATRIIKAINHILLHEGTPLIVGHGGNFRILIRTLNIPHTYDGIENCALLLFTPPPEDQSQWAMSVIGKKE